MFSNMCISIYIFLLTIKIPEWTTSFIGCKLLALDAIRVVLYMHACMQSNISSFDISVFLSIYQIILDSIKICNSIYCQPGTQKQY